MKSKLSLIAFRPFAVTGFNCTMFCRPITTNSRIEMVCGVRRSRRLIQSHRKVDSIQKNS